MTTYAPRRLWLLLLLLACSLLAVRLLTGLGGLRGAAARNAGFLAFNAVRTVGEGTEPPNDQITRGIEQLTQATTLASGNESALRALGYLHLATGAEAEALAAWQRTDMVATELLDKGEAAEEGGHAAEAQRWYERATIVDPTLVEAWLRVGRRHETDGNWEAAEATYAAGLVAAPNSGDLLYQMGHARARTATGDDWLAILSIIDFALARDQYEHDWNRAQTHFLRGEALRGLGRQSEALAEYSKVLADYPADYWAALRRAEMYWAAGGDPVIAETLFQAVVALDPESKWAYHYLGHFYAATNRAAEARAQFERALGIDPADPVALEWLGRQ